MPMVRYAHANARARRREEEERVQQCRSSLSSNQTELDRLQNAIKGKRPGYDIWGNLLVNDEYTSLRNKINEEENRITKGRTILSTLNGLDKLVGKAKNDSFMTQAHRNALADAESSTYSEVKAKRTTVLPSLKKIPGLGFGRDGDVLNLVKQDLNSGDPKTRALALRRLYQAEKNANENNLSSSTPATYAKHMLDETPQVAAASIRAMIEEPALRPAHYNQVLASALMSKDYKLQKGALLGLKNQLSGSSPTYVRSILVDHALEHMIDHHDFGHPVKNHKLMALAREVQKMRNEARKNPSVSVAQEAADDTTAPFASNRHLNRFTAKAVNAFTNPMFSPDQGHNVLLYTYGDSGIGKSQYMGRVGQEALGKGSTIRILAADQSASELKERLKKEATGFRDGKYRFDGRTLFFDEFHQLADAPQRKGMMRYLKELFNNEDMKDMDFKNSMITVATNGIPENIPGFQGDLDGQSLLSRLNAGRTVHLSSDIKDDISGFVYRYEKGKPYMDRNKHLEGVSISLPAQEIITQDLQAEFPVNGHRRLEPRAAVARISQEVQDALNASPILRNSRRDGDGFTVKVNPSNQSLFATL